MCTSVSAFPEQFYKACFAEIDPKLKSIAENFAYFILFFYLFPVFANKTFIQMQNMNNSQKSLPRRSMTTNDNTDTNSKYLFTDTV